MDASDDRDVKLQRASADLLSDIERRLPKLLRKDGSVRQYVRHGSLQKLIDLLEPFQEMPQLLDPKLATFVPVIVDAFVDFLILHKGSYPKSDKVKNDAIPLPRAICRLLYVLCKIRGEKVISRFFDHRPNLLEPMLAAFEAWGKQTRLTGEDDSHPAIVRLTWEEKYIMLLWLSQLLLAPFDLANLSSAVVTAQSLEGHGIVSFKLPDNVPYIAVRTLTLALEHLPSAGKERESAKTLLVRLTVRPDMNKLGLSECVIRWVMETLTSRGDSSGTNPSLYEAVGILSFLAGVLAAGEKGIVSPFIVPIYRSAFAIATDDKSYGYLTGSALGKRMIIKLLRTIAILTLRPETRSAGGISEETVSSILEDTIDYLLTSLAAADTPIRFAASKALSQITLQLDSDMAAEVVEAILGSLNEDVLAMEATSSSNSANDDLLRQRTMRKSLATVNPGRWHGLVLSLAQLLLRRSPPQSQLPEILKVLMNALTFEQRSATGVSVGANVRDAACFGIWAVVRGYSTQQLLAIDVKSIVRSLNSQSDMTVLHALAIELVVSGCLDPSGNIRRGSSAALQELIGRHPDTIINGIPLVQVVDYHAVALRSRALTQVASDASRLGKVYWEALFRAMLDWRGIGSPDEVSRRMTAKAIGLLSEIIDGTTAKRMFADITSVLGALRSTEVEERHGLLLALASLLDSAIWQKYNDQNLSDAELSSLLGRDFPSQILSQVSALPENDFVAFSRRPELTAEASCVLVSSLLRRCQLLQLSLSDEDFGACLRIISLSLPRSDEVTITSTSTAARNLFSVLNSQRRSDLVRQWIDLLVNGKKSVVTPSGHLASLGAVFALVSGDRGEGLSKDQNDILNAILSYCTENIAVEFRVAALQSLRNGVIKSKTITSAIVDALQASLRDYSVDQRGDVGSWVRLEAVDAVCEAWKHQLLSDAAQRLLLPEVCRLAGEKLDKVRYRAWLCLRELAALHSSTHALSLFNCSSPDLAYVSTETYFSQLLQLLLSDICGLRLPLLEGIFISAGGGYESLLRASRNSLAKFVYELSVEGGGYNLVEFCKDINQVIKTNLSNDRVLIPSLDVVSYLFDTGSLQRASEARGETGWRALLSLVQKAHYKSTNMPKLSAAIQVYAGLGEIPAIKQESLSKLLSLLLHPFPLVRNMAAEIIFTTLLPDSQVNTCSAELQRTNWSASPKELKERVNKLRAALIETR
ncbi:hypothetical protein L228DRAFT_282050 [Xylona heveae TC161]|uniref:Uncharacterized protein n=1 Tax=Xylona heveae (strain CBS 132557 / TC161) TaxID=1328760 RepID=A0A165HCR9_XYLHT|nr:hypothetical protein L228DRAFT_282050 [Xylona heveae TC161]KZF23312.1 hypothetical protein L228DRAFT_282050 [Xylona heveae TC161]